ncbi:MAG: hypothetical protein HY902_16595 [Deltaproteobacteria bacterium]|nr:hypothetical protein [Deltaproteobacteria bacterium]
MPRLLHAFFVATALLLATTAAHADDTQALRKAIAANQPIWVRAPLDANPKMLGNGYDDNFSEYDAAGKGHRVFAAKSTSADIDRYDVQFVQIDDAMKLKAAANFLFASAGVQANSDSRYVWIQVFHLTKVVSLVRGGAPKDAAKLVAEKVYYGSACNIIVSGSASTFTLDLAAKLKSGGGDLRQFTSKYNLDVKYLTDGLKLKPGMSVPLEQDANKIMGAFAEGKPQPIFVEFLPMQEMFTLPIEWAKAKFVPGKYKITRIDLTLADSKADGRPWDALGDLPDPMVYMYTGGKPKQGVNSLCSEASCTNLAFTRNTFKATFTPDKLIDLAEGVPLYFVVWDKDMSEHDYAGETVPTDVLKVGTPLQSIPLNVEGQLRNFSITLEPVN